MCTAEWSASGTCAALQKADHPPRRIAFLERENKGLWRSTFCDGTSHHNDTPRPPVATDAVWTLGHVTVDHAWARLAAGTRTSIYLRITNDGVDPDQLVKVETPIAALTVVLENSSADGTPKARTRGIEILPKFPFLLQPGGGHIQLQNLAVEFTSGEVLPLQLVLEKAGTLHLAVPILPLTESDPF